MPVKRRVLKGRKLVITPELLATFVAAERLLEDGSGEADGDRREEFLDLFTQLHMGLGLTSWDTSVLSDACSGPEPPRWLQAERHAQWRRAWHMRQQFLAAARAAARPKRPRRAKKAASPGPGGGAG